MSDWRSAAARATDSAWKRAGQEQSTCRFKGQPHHVCVRSTGAPIEPGEVCWYEAAAQFKERPVCCLCQTPGAVTSELNGVPAHSECVVDYEMDRLEAYELSMGDAPPIGD